MSKRERIYERVNVVRVRITALPIKRERVNERHGTYTLMELGAKQCRYATSPEQARKHLFCGRPTDKSGVYCEWHHSKTVDKRGPLPPIKPTRDYR